MKHATATALVRLAVVLRWLRACPGLKEPRSGVFYLKSRAFLHFHEDPAGLFADVRAPGDEDFVRLPVNTPAEVLSLMAKVDQGLNRNPIKS